MATKQPITKRKRSTKKPKGAPKYPGGLTRVERALIKSYRAVPKDAGAQGPLATDSATPQEREARKHFGYAECTAGALLEFARNLAKVPCDPANSRLIMETLANEMRGFLKDAVEWLPVAHAARPAASSASEALQDLAEMSDQWIDSELGEARRYKAEALRRALAALALDAARELHRALVAVGTGGCEFLEEHELSAQANAAPEAAHA